MGGVVRQQPLLVAGELEEVAFLLDELKRPAAVGVGAEAPALLVGRGVGLAPEGLVGDAVVAFIVALVDVAGRNQRREDLRDLLLVAGLGGADEVVVADVQVLPEVAELDGDLVGILPGGLARLAR